MLLVEREFKRSGNTLFYSICKHQKMPKVAKRCSEVWYEHSDFLAMFHCASSSILASSCNALLFTFTSEVLAFCFIYFKPNKKMPTAFRIRNCRRFILEYDFFKICLFVCGFLCLLGLQGTRCGCVQLMEHEGVQGGIENVTTKPEFIP